MISQNTKKTAVKAAINGAILAAAASTVYGNGSLIMMGRAVPAAVPLFAVGALTSGVNEIIHDQLGTPSISASYLAGDYASLALNAGVAGLATVGIMSTAVGLPSQNYMGAFILGSGSVIGTDLLEKRFLEQNGRLIF